MGEAKQPLLEPSFNRAVKVFASDDQGDCTLSHLPNKTFAR